MVSGALILRILSIVRQIARLPTAILVCFAAIDSVAEGPAANPQPPGLRSARRARTVESLPNSPLGTNLDSVNDWSTELPFVDYFKMARTWITQCRFFGMQDPGCTSMNNWDTGEESQLDLDAQGWVRSLPSPQDSPIFTSAATILFTSGDARLNPEIEGDFIVAYDGEGTVEYGLGARLDASRSHPGRDVVNFTPADGSFLLRIVRTDPQGIGDYIRNIRIVRPTLENNLRDQPFNRAFLDRLQNFRVLRFMDWMRTNGSPQQEWNQRPLITDSTYSSTRGVPAEVLMDLANRTNTEPWFNMPHQASDDYIRQFAVLAKQRLQRNLRVYIEYSNETWNAAFPQYSWLVQQGRASFAAGDDFQRAINWSGRRTAEMCDIWKSTWGESGYRVICVAASQAANAWTAMQVLDCPLWSQGAPCAGHGLSALAIAPYIGGYLGNPAFQSQVESWTFEPDGGLASLFGEMTDGGRLTGASAPLAGALSQSLGWVAANRIVAQEHSVELIAYEGGQHLVGIAGVENNAAISELFISANRNARMGQLYSNFLAGWRDRGGRLFVNFSLAEKPSRWGSWGILEYITQPGSPKFDALTQFAAANPCWWDRCAVPPLFKVFIPFVH